MEENKENVINAEELKSEASNTVNQVKETMKNVNIKEETKVAKNFVTEMFRNPLGKINEIAKDSTNKNFKTAIIIVAIWAIIVLVKSISTLSKYREVWDNVLIVIKTTIAPILEIIVLSVIVFIMNKKSKKSLIIVLTTMATAYVPVILAAIVSLLTLISYSAYKITSPIAALGSVITTVLTYFGMKSLFEETENATFIKKFVLIEAIYILVAFIVSYLGISL